MQTLITLCLSIALALGAIIATEASLPLDWKPSILLRQSTGELPPHLTKSLEDEKIRAEGLEFETRQARENASDLAASIGRIEEARAALEQRVQEKGAEFNYYLGGS